MPAPLFISSLFSGTSALLSCLADCASLASSCVQPMLQRGCTCNLAKWHCGGRQGVRRAAATFRFRSSLTGSLTAAVTPALQYFTSTVHCHPKHRPPRCLCYRGSPAAFVPALRSGQRGRKRVCTGPALACMTGTAAATGPICACRDRPLMLSSCGLSSVPLLLVLTSASSGRWSAVPSLCCRVAATSDRAAPDTRKPLLLQHS